MGSRYLNDLKEWTFTQALPIDFEVREGQLQRQITVEGSPEGVFNADFASFDTILLSQTLLRVSQPATCKLAESGRTIGMYFNLSGSQTFHGSGETHLLGAGHHMIYFASGDRKEIELTPEDGMLQGLEVNIPVSYYTHLFSGYSDQQSQFIQRVLMGSESFVPLGIMPMTVPIKWIIGSIQRSTRTGLLKRMFLEAKILELLMLQVEQAELQVIDRVERIVRSSDVEAILEAKNILEKAVDNPPSIRDLARMVGLNEFSLKKGFRETYQTTIFGYVNALKMHQARQLILEGDKTINEIALLSGYKNPQHFTVAFKKYFGQLPSKLRA